MTDRLAMMKRVYCAVFGHSDLIDGCIGYMYCGRCSAQLGDTLGGIYRNERAVIRGHGCDTCRENWTKMPMRSRLLAGSPELDHD